MVVVPTLLSRPQEIDDLLEALAIRYLVNRDPNLFFALLTDFPDAPERILPDDDALLARARAAVQALNEVYREDRPCIFYLFHRPRVWNPCERVWMGYERKRGKLEQFNALLRGGEQAAFPDSVGDASILPSIRYVITLDTDTQLPRDAARTLIGNMAHPLNRPVFDADKGRIVEGYAILQPRASISLTSASQSRFTKLFAGESGIDPYSRQVSDVYQDMFGEGSFIGKGIYDVDAFRQTVDGRFPENCILSHDLLESGYARSALVTDVELIEEHPASYAIEASRRHRWIRGDWQLAGWLLPRVPGPPELKGSKTRRQPNPLTALSVWKLFDNLRRSLVPPALFALLAGGADLLLHPLRRSRPAERLALGPRPFDQLVLGRGDGLGGQFDAQVAEVDARSGRQGWIEDHPRALKVLHLEAILDQDAGQRVAKDGAPAIGVEKAQELAGDIVLCLLKVARFCGLCKREGGQRADDRAEHAERKQSPGSTPD